MKGSTGNVEDLEFIAFDIRTTTETPVCAHAPAHIYPSKMLFIQDKWHRVHEYLFV